MEVHLPDRRELQFTAIRSRGPGGQNVNKVNSAALMQWDFMLSHSLTEEQKNLINEKLYNYINADEIFYIRSDEFRDLERNQSRCIEKLEQLLRFAFFKPKPRKKTKPTKSSKRKRLDNKKQRGDIKKSRRAPEY
ncbi:MAG: alternative ribosome rescue aminoacyl-tRNA hydrolase ArfB [Bdellovibrionales bacterium]